MCFQSVMMTGYQTKQYNVQPHLAPFPGCFFFVVNYSQIVVRHVMTDLSYIRSGEIGTNQSIYLSSLICSSSTFHFIMLLHTAVVFIQTWSSLQSFCFLYGKECLIWRLSSIIICIYLITLAYHPC